MLALAAATAPWLVAGAAAAQADRAVQADAGRRYLGWSGRPPSVTPAATGPAAVSGRTAMTAPDLRPGLIPHAGVDRSPYPLRPAFAPSAPSGGPNALTPAEAWLRPAPMQQTTPLQQASMTPASSPRPAAPAPAPAPAVSTSLPTSAPPPTGTPASRPADVLDPSPVVVDPYAPRRDAPIFRIGAAAPSPAPVQAPSSAPDAATPSDQADGGGSRYYSVHRQAGREPDATVLPEPFFLDVMPESLAQPPEPPVMMRDAQGRLRPASTPDGGDPALP